MIWARRVIMGGALLSLAACASTDPDAGFAAMDPYENTNRAIHDFNVAVDRNVLRPAAQGYDFVTPAVFKHLFGNIFSHLDLPVDFANYLLQGDMRAAGRTLGRFTLNTTIGGGGFLDPATEFGLAREETDFGVTLGKWGVEPGAYLVLPLFGPSTPRDLAGFVVDRAFSPTTYIGYGTDATAWEVLNPSLAVLERVDLRDRNADLIDELLYESEDSYVTLRSVYLQRRQSLVAGGDSTEALPDIFDEEPATTQ